MAVPFALSKDGIESQWAVNHFSHFLLSARLFPLLLKSPEPRVICVSSVGHKLLGPKSADVSYDLEKINDPKLYPWNEFKIYGETKAANILFARGLQRKFDASDKTAYVNTCHPGNIATDLGSKTAYSSRILTWLSNLFLITPEQGALTQTYLASSPDVVEKGYKGEYFVPYAQLSRSTAATEDKGLQEKLWKWSEDVLRSKGFEV